MSIDIPKHPTHAVHFYDNWDGEGDRYFTFAFEHQGRLHAHSSGEPLIERVGDEILDSWELKPTKETAGDVSE